MQDSKSTSYTRRIRALLDRSTFEPARSRLWWLPVHVAVIAAGTMLLARGHLSAWLCGLLSLPIGASFAGLTFLAHETMHGAVVRGRSARRLVGWLGFLPFVLSPRLWLAWHNHVHHGNANRAGRDPDAYPTLEEYQQNRAVRIATEAAAPGLGRLRGLASLLIGFSVQSLHMLLAARRRGYLSPREHTFALLETLAGIAVWSALGFAIGVRPFLFAFVLPLAIANAIVMGFILTNHSLNPLAPSNDPLATSLTVTTPRWLEWLTLGFGFHVEHHLFPAMSARFAPRVRQVLLERFASSYQSMPLWRATIALHQGARVYKDASTLIDPSSGRQWPTLSSAHAAQPAYGSSAEGAAFEPATRRIVG